MFGNEKRINSAIMGLFLLLCPILFQLLLIDNQSFRWAHYRWYFFISCLLMVIIRYFKVSWEPISNFLLVYFIMGYSVPFIFKVVKNTSVNGEFFWDEISFATGILSFFYILIFSIRQAGYRVTGFLSAIELLLLVPYIVNIGYSCMTLDVIDVNAVIAIYQTNLKEAWEFIINSAPYIVYIVALFALCISFCFLFYTLDNIRVSNVSYNKTKLIKIGLCFLGICLVINKTIDNSYFVRIIEESQDYLRTIKEYNSYRVNQDGGLKAIDAKATSICGDETFVVVIGESQNRNHMSAYGYDRKTTPWLDKMINDKHFVIMDNGYACHTLTMLALSQALTEKSQYNKLPLEKSYSIIDIARAAGYKTYWISNQAQFGTYNTPVTAIVNFCDESIWLNSDSAASTAYDGSILEVLHKIPKKGKKIVFIHLYGNHWAYRHRYPADKFSFFKENYYKEKVKSIQTINEYDNSMLYNDYIMQQIFSYAKMKWNMDGLLYFADHGEAVKSGNNHIPGKYELDMTTIPTYLYFSDYYIENNKEKFLRIQSRKKRAFTNDMVFNMLIDIWGIVTPYYNPKENCFDDRYSFSLEKLKCLDDKPVK